MVHESTLFAAVVDSGERREFTTGARRDMGKGKGRFDLVPFYSLFRLAIHYENGSVKYGDNNWQKGMPLRQYLDSAGRHLYKYLGGMRDEDHMAAVAWNIFGYMWTENEIRAGRLPKELDDLGATDRPLWEKVVEDAQKAAA